MASAQSASLQGEEFALDNLMKLGLKYRSLSDPVRASLWFTICSFVQKGISFITVPIFTRLMSTEQYGMYSLFLSWDSVIIVFATLNLSYQVFNNGLVKYEDDRDAYTSSMLGLSNVCTTVLLVLYLLFRNIINEISGLNTPLFLLMFLQYYFNQALALWTVKERFFYRYRALTCITLGSAIVSSIIGVVAVLFAQDKVFARVASLALVNVIVGVCIYLQVIRRGRKLVCWKYWKYVLVLNLPLIPHYLSMTALGSVDRILIGSICGASFTALYSISFNIASILNLLLSSINSSYIPWFYQKMHDGDSESISKVSTALLLVVGVCSLIPALFGPEVVRLLGSEKYMDGIWVMPSVSVGVYFTFAYSLFSNYELYFDESRIIMVASLTAAALNIGLNLLLLPILGFVAAGYVSLGCYIALSFFHYLGMRIVAKRKGGRTIPFDLKLVVAISIILLVLSLGVTVLYFNTLLRYVVLIVLLAIMFAKRRLILDAIGSLK